MQDTAGEVGTNTNVTYSCKPLHMNEQKQDDQLEPIYNSSVLIHDVALKTYREWWTIETGGGRGSDRSVLAAWYDDDDTFPKGICPKVNIIAWLEFELAYYDPDNPAFNHYTTVITPTKWMNEINNLKWQRCTQCTLPFSLSRTYIYIFYIHISMYI